MKIKLLIILPLMVVLFGCSKDELSGDGYFNITTTGKKTISTTYVTEPIPTKNGTFSFQYNKPGRIMFWVLGDSNNNSDVDISLPTEPIIDKVYKTNYINDQEIYFGVYIDNEDVDLNGECLGEVVFTSFTHPGLIQGTVKLVKRDGTVLSTGEFNFVSK